MRLPPAPDLNRPGRTALAVLAAGLAVCVVVYLRTGLHLGADLGDTDDATRLVLVRDLLHGRGWFDQRVTRLQPPMGVWLHWSRLLDGGLALLDRAYGLVMPPAQAELWMRRTWPLLWVFAACGAAVAGARRLADTGPRGPQLASAAVLAAAVVLVFDLDLFGAQFHSGRIDHHDVQITLALAAAAAAYARGPRVRGAVAAGAAVALGLAVGLEALVFEAVVAASFGLRLLADRGEARRTAAFGLTLAAGTLLAFLAQTPPARWGVPACDALGVNLLAGAAVGGLTLAAAARLGARRAWPARLGLLTAGGALTLAVYLLLDPRCLHGPFADVDPAMRPFWLDHVQEMRDWPKLLKAERGSALAYVVFVSMGMAAWLLTGLSRSRRRTAAWPLSGALLFLGAAAGWGAYRMDAYGEWFSVAPLAVLAAEISTRLPKRGGVVASLLVALLLSPVVATAGVLAADRAWPWRKPGAGGGGGDGPADRCFDRASYRPLARLPAGVAVGEIDVGPFVLAHTPHAALSAPYHRMNYGVMRARAIVAAPVDQAQARLRALEADVHAPVYVLECPVHARHADRDGLLPDALQRRLDQGRPPAWLQRLSPAGAPLQVYGLRPAAPAAPAAGPTAAAR